MRSALLVTALLVPVACSGPSALPPTTPTPAVPTGPVTQSTVYSGHYRMTSCGECGAWQGRYWAFSLTVTRTGDNYTGELRSDPWNLEATLSGTRRGDGAIVMNGTAGPANGTLLGATFSDVVVFEDPVRGLHGSFRYVTHNTHGSGMPIVAAIDSATVGPLASTTPAGIVGAWAGTAKNDRPCTSEICNPDPAFSLLVVQAGSGYRAYWDLAETPRAALLLNGTQVEDAIVFTGEAAGADGVAPDGNLDVRRLAVRIDANGSLTGEFDYTGRTSVSTPRHTGVVVGQRRVISFSPGPFEGAWRGEHVTRRCDGDCSAFRVNSNVLRLTLTQAGNQVSGMYNTEFPLAGTATGSSVVLTGGTETEHVRIVVTGVDEWGVMSGSMSHTRKGRSDSTTTTGDLFRMVRQIR